MALSKTMLKAEISIKLPIFQSIYHSQTFRKYPLYHIRKCGKVQYNSVKGTALITKKSINCKAIIQKHSKDFGGSLEDPDVIKL